MANMGYLKLTNQNNILSKATGASRDSRAGAIYHTLMNQRKRIFITGATGFIGSYILRYFLRKGYENITATKRQNSSLDLVYDIVDKVNWVDCDLTDISILYDAIKPEDIVIHAAALVSVQARDKDKMLAYNMGVTRNMVKCFIRKKHL